MAMASSDICLAGEDRVDLTRMCAVNGETECLFVSRIYESIARLEDGVQSA